jgi:hypothetical protein
MLGAKFGTIKHLQKSILEWREAKPPKGEPGPIYGFRRGYEVAKAGRHETADQFTVFQKFLLLQGDRSFINLEEVTGIRANTLAKWSKMWQWQKRAAAYDKSQMAIVWSEAEKLQRNAHRDAVLEFRESSERQARMMAKVSEDLLRMVGRRIHQAEQEGEEVPMSIVSNLLRSAASVSEQSRQSWGNALGINEMMEMVEQEMEKIQIEDVTDVDAYDIPLDE